MIKNYECKVFQNYGAGWGKITDEHIEFIEEGGWDIVYFNSDPRKNYLLQLKREVKPRDSARKERERLRKKRLEEEK